MLGCHTKLVLGQDGAKKKPTRWWGRRKAEPRSGLRGALDALRAAQVAATLLKAADKLLAHLRPHHLHAEHDDDLAA